MDGGESKFTSNAKNDWTPFLRQLFVSSGVWPSFFIVGLSIGAPTVFVPQIRREANSTDAITDDMASWLSSTTFYAGIPWIFILTIIAQIYGRIVPMIIVSLTSLIGFLVFYYSSNMAHILICNGLIGVSSGSQITTSILVLTEYTSPRYRGLLLTIKSASMFWGIWTANAIGTFYHWKNISYIGILCSLYALISLIFWPQSPYWLASKNRFDECQKSHRWLKGCSLESEQELQKLMTVETKVNKRSLRRFWKSFKTHKLYKSILVTAIVLALYHFSGKLVCSIYAIDIIKNITSNEYMAYTGMLILDGVTVLSMYVGCIISKFVKRRTQLLVSSSLAVACLFVLSLYLYLAKIKVIDDNKVVCLVILMLFSMSICCGPIIMSTSVSGEILPLKCRNFCVCAMGTMANLFAAIALNFGPTVFKSFGLDGAFLFYGICSCVFLYLSYKYLPETKDKTLQEIQDSLKGEPKRTDEMVKLNCCY